MLDGSVRDHGADATAEEVAVGAAFAVVAPAGSGSPPLQPHRQPINNTRIILCAHKKNHSLIEADPLIVFHGRLPNAKANMGYWWMRMLEGK